MENLEIKKTILEIGKEYKIFSINDFMAFTSSQIVKVKDFVNDKYIIVFKNKNNRYGTKKYYLNLNSEMIVIPLNECILKADSETGNFMGNAKFNFLNTEKEIREQLLKNKNTDFKTSFGINRVENGEYIPIIL